jgi:hypothetical protein
MSTSCHSSVEGVERRADRLGKRHRRSGFRRRDLVNSRRRGSAAGPRTRRGGWRLVRLALREDVTSDGLAEIGASKRDKILVDKLPTPFTRLLRPCNFRDPEVAKRRVYEHRLRTWIFLLGNDLAKVAVESPSQQLLSLLFSRLTGKPRVRIVSKLRYYILTILIFPYRHD